MARRRETDMFRIDIPHFNIPKVAFERPWEDDDKDLVPNILDCRPQNPKLQHIKPSATMRARLKRLPIFITERPIVFGKRMPQRKSMYHISEKKAPRKPKQRFLSVIKRHPGVIGEIERKKPRAVIITTARAEEGTGYEVYGEATPTQYGRAEEGRVAGSGAVIIRTPIRKHAKKPETQYGQEEKKEAAGTAYHELEHVRQQKELKPKILLKMHKGRYEKQQAEVLAREAERKKIKEREEPSHVTKKHYWKGFRRMFKKGRR